MTESTVTLSAGSIVKGERMDGIHLCPPGLAHVVVSIAWLQLEILSDNPRHLLLVGVQLDTHTHPRTKIELVGFDTVNRNRWLKDEFYSIS